MIKFGDNIDFSYVLEEVESSIRGEYICPCDTTEEDCDIFSLNQKYIDSIVYGPKSKYEAANVPPFDEGDRTGGWLLYPSIPYRSKTWLDRFNGEKVKLEILLKRKVDVLDANPDAPALDLDQMIKEAAEGEFIEGSRDFSDPFDLTPDTDVKKVTGFSGSDKGEHVGLLNLNRPYFNFGAHFTEHMRISLTTAGVGFKQTGLGIQLAGGQDIRGIALKAAQIAHQKFFFNDGTGKSEMGLKSGCIDKSSFDGLVGSIAYGIAGKPDRAEFNILIQSAKFKFMHQLGPYIKSGRVVTTNFSPGTSPRAPGDLN